MPATRKNKIEVQVGYDAREVKAGVRDTTQDIRNLSSGARSASGGLGLMGKAAGLAGGAFAALQIGDMVADVYAMGDASLRSERALTAVAGGAEEAAATVTAMREATGGLISEAEAASHATSLMALGLADNAQEAANFTRIAATLGSVVGTDLAGGLDALRSAIANQSYDVLDSLGISSGRVRVEVEKLRDAGYSLEEAFQMAVMEQAAAKVDALEAAGYEAGTSLERLMVKGTDAATAVGERLATGVLTLTDAIEDNWDSITRYADVIDRLQYDAADSAEAFRAGQAAYYEHATAVQAAATADGILAVSIASVRDELNALPLDDTRAQSDLVAASFVETARAMGYTNLQVIDLWESTGGLKDELGNLHANSSTIPPSMAAIEGSAYGAARGMMTAATATRDFKDAIDELNNQRTGNYGRNSAVATNLPMDTLSFRERRDMQEVVAMGISPTASATTALELEVQARRFAREARERIEAGIASASYSGGGGGVRSAGAAAGRELAEEYAAGLSAELDPSNAEGVRAAVMDFVQDQAQIDKLRDDLKKSLAGTATGAQVDLALTDLFGARATPIDLIMDSLTASVENNAAQLADAGAAVGEHIERGLETRFANIGDRIVGIVLDALAEAAA